ncbi:MAG: hypothetical protein GY841_13120 [FCB group bacterium]|nr:hypothetical protein [FCB group bacterium]
MSAAHGNKVNNYAVVYAKTEAAITVAEGTALCVTYTGDEFGEVKLPAADGVQCAGFIYESTSDAGEIAKVATREQFWVPVAEAISINDELMATSTTGAVKVLTATKYKVGRALTDQATTAGYVLVEALIGSKEET